MTTDPTILTSFVSPSGDELVVITRGELEALRGARDDAIDADDVAASRRALAEHEAGRDEGLTAEEIADLAQAPTPLAFWRRKRGLTQDQLAAASGVGQGYLSDIESGRRDGTVQTLKALAGALGITLDDVV